MPLGSPVIPLELCPAGLCVRKRAVALLSSASSNPELKGKRHTETIRSAIQFGPSEHVNIAFLYITAFNRYVKSKLLVLLDLRRAHILLALVNYCTTCTTSTTSTTSATSTTISTNQSGLRLTTVPVRLLPTVLYYCHCCWCAYDGVPVPVSVVVPVQKPVSVPVPAPVLSAAAANRY